MLRPIPIKSIYVVYSGRWQSGAMRKCGNAYATPRPCHGHCRYRLSDKYQFEAMANALTIQLYKIRHLVVHVLHSCVDTKLTKAASIE